MDRAAVIAGLSRYFLFLIFSILLALGILQSNTIAQFPGISLRFHAQISGQTAFESRQYAAQADTPYSFWPTFWHQHSASLFAGLRTAQTTAISFSGDAMSVWPADYITGNAPGQLDTNGIAVSKALAHRLWGSVNVIGMRVYVNDVPRTVRGVFAGETDLALLSYHIEYTGQYWTAAELAGGPAHPTRNCAESFAISAGLGLPNHILMNGPGAISRVMAFSPLILLAVYALGLLVKFTQKYYPKAIAPIFIAGGLLLAILLPAMFNALPPWLIPTQFSDFQFWGNLISQAQDSFREFLSATPMQRDIELRLHLIRQIVIFILTLCIGLVIPTLLTLRASREYNYVHSQTERTIPK